MIWSWSLHKSWMFNQRSDLDTSKKWDLWCDLVPFVSIFQRKDPYIHSKISWTQNDIPRSWAFRIYGSFHRKTALCTIRHKIGVTGKMIADHDRDLIVQDFEKVIVSDRRSQFGKSIVSDRRSRKMWSDLALHIPSIFTIRKRGGLKIFLVIGNFKKLD